MKKPFTQTAIAPSYQRVRPISDVLYVDQRVLNFERTLPGKLLGSSLVVGNYTDYEQIVELAIDV